MDQVVDLDSPATWARVIVEKAAIFKKVCPWPWKTYPLHTIGTPYGMHTHEVVITNLKRDNLMLVILCISNNNLMIF
jgi:hypothetical protein